MVYYIKAPEIAVSILCDVLRKPFSVLPAAVVTYYVGTCEIGISIPRDGMGKPLSVYPAAGHNLLCINV